uniref:Uncharacterized protein n=1 Tax=Rhizobium phage IG49 TaxID=3129228 RepID=A0AAU8HZI9_9CAUD
MLSPYKGDVNIKFTSPRIFTKRFPGTRGNGPWLSSSPVRGKGNFHLPSGGSRRDECRSRKR